MFELSRDAMRQLELWALSEYVSVSSSGRLDNTRSRLLDIATAARLIERALESENEKND